MNNLNLSFLQLRIKSQLLLPNYGIYKRRHFHYNQRLRFRTSRRWRHHQLHPSNFIAIFSEAEKCERGESENLENQDGQDWSQNTKIGVWKIQGRGITHVFINIAVISILGSGLVKNMHIFLKMPIFRW